MNEHEMCIRDGHQPEWMPPTSGTRSIGTRSLIRASVWALRRDIRRTREEAYFCLHPPLAMSFDSGAIISLIQNSKALYDCSSDVKHSSAERRQLLDEVRSLQTELETLQSLTNMPGVADDQVMMERLAQLLDPSKPFATAVDETLARVKDVLIYGTCNPKANRFKVLGKRGAAALWRTVDKAEVKELLSDLERYKNQIRRALEDDMSTNIITKYHLKIAQFFSETDVTGHQQSLLQRRIKNTGAWLIHDPNFVAWRDDRDSPRALWYYGHPGAGKSIMAATVVEHLQSRGDFVLSVFCRYSESDTFTTPYPVLCGLLRQLVEKSPKILPSVYDLYQSQTRPDPDALSVLLTDIATFHTQPIYIVIDALDECQFAVDLLGAIQRVGPSFRVLVTSRPLFREINDAPSIEIRASDEDILIAVNTTLSKLNHGWLDEELKDTIRMKVVEIAGGMFLLASLQLRELESVASRHDVVAILDSLPRSLDEAYKLTFQRIREQGERKNELASRTLALIALHSFEETHVQHLLAEGDVTKYTGIETILQCCQGLVQSINVYLRLVFTHYSVYEYITSHWSELFPENPNRFNICLELGYSALTGLNSKKVGPMNILCWSIIVGGMKDPEQLDWVVNLLSTPEARASLIEYQPGLAPLVRDPLLIACCFGYRGVVQHMIRTAPSPPDVRRFNEALLVVKLGGFGDEEFTKGFREFIDARSDMRVNGDGVVVAVDLSGGEGR